MKSKLLARTLALGTLLALSCNAFATNTHRAARVSRAVTAPVASTEAVGDGAGGHGGGGVMRHGEYQTFYHAGFYTEPTTPSDGLKVPQMDALVSAISHFPSLSTMSKSTFLNAIIPSPSRTYLKIDASSFDATTRKNLLDEYARVVNQDRSSIELFAVTDTSKGITYLLPAFYQLKNPQDQMAILFHEGFWILHPDAQYKEVVKAEMAFQAVLAQPDDGLRVIEFMKDCSMPAADLMQAAVALDLKTGALPPTLPFVDLVGQEFIACTKVGSSECMPLITAPLYSLMEQYPKSAVLKLFQIAFAKSGDGTQAIRFVKLSGSLSFPTDMCEVRQVANEPETCTISIKIDVPIEAPYSYSFPFSCTGHYSIPDIGLHF